MELLEEYVNLKKEDILINNMYALGFTRLAYKFDSWSQNIQIQEISTEMID